MLTHPILNQLNALGLKGMAPTHAARRMGDPGQAFNEFNDSDQTAGLRHAEWLALLLDREAVHRHDKRLGRAPAVRQAPPPGLPGGHRLPRPSRGWTGGSCRSC